MYIEKFAALIVSRPKSVVLAICALTALASYFIPPQLDNSIRNLIIRNSTNIERYEYYLENYSSDRSLVAALLTPDLATPEAIKLLTNLVDAFSDVPAEELDLAGEDRVKVTEAVGYGVVYEEVVSLPNISIVEGTEDGTFSIGPLVDEQPQTVEEAREIFRRLERFPFLDRLIVDTEGQATALRMRINAGVDGEKAYTAVVKKAREILDEEVAKLPGTSYYLAGSPVLITEISQGMRRDLFSFLILPSLLIALTLFVVFRTMQGVILPQLTVLITLALVLGGMSAMGVAINAITTIIPALILTIAVTDVIHVVAQYFEELTVESDQKKAVRNTIVHVFPPCLLTSLTTSAGFASLATADLDLVREFGLIAAGAVILAFVVSVTFVPALLLLVRVPPAGRKVDMENGLLARVLRRIGDFNHNHRWKIVIVSALLMVVSVMEGTGLRIETSLREYFREDTEVRRAFRFLDSRLSGISTSIFFVNGEPGAMKEPENLRAIDELAAHMKNYHIVRNTVTIADYVKAINRATEGGDERFYAIPASREVVANYLFLAEGSGTIDSLTNPDYSETIVTGLCGDVSTIGIGEMIEGSRAWAAEHFPPGLKFESSGLMTLSVEMANKLVTGQIKSFGLAIITIFAMMALLFRSVRIGLLSTVPNVAPILLTLGFMVLANVKLNASTVMVASVALGIAVDDTIHLLVRFKRELAKDGDYEAAQKRSVRTIGRPIVFTSVVLSCGFGIMMLANLVPPVHFGMLTAFCMVMALLGDLFLLPSLLIIVKPRMGSLRDTIQQRINGIKRNRSNGEE